MTAKHPLRTVAAVLLLCPALHAGSLDNNVIGLFPRSVGEFAYVDLSEARQFTWFAQFQQQVLPASVVSFEQFVSSAGINPNSQIKEVAWGFEASVKGPHGERGSDVVDGDIVGVVTGDFDPDSAQTAFKAKKLPTLEVNGYTLYSCAVGADCGDLYFFFIDSHTAAFGQLPMLRRLTDVKTGVAESLLSNEVMFPLIDQVNGHAPFWGVFNSAGALRAIQHLAPTAAKFDGSEKLLSNLKSLVISVESSSDTDVHFRILCGSVVDSVFLSQMLQAALLLRKYQEGEGQSALTDLLDQTSIVTNGNSLDVAFDVSNDELISLIQENAFAFKIDE